MKDEDIVNKRNHPPVRREGGRIRAVVQGTDERERGGGGYQILKKQYIKTFGDGIIG